MKTLKQLIEGKNKKLAAVAPEQTVLRAIEIMAEVDVGALLVLDGKRLCGVFSERDYSRKIVLQGRTSRDTLVGDILSFPAITVQPGSPIHECMERMTTHRVRHLPVIENGKLAGIVSIGDLVNWVILSQRQAIAQLHGYISGGYPG